MTRERLNNRRPGNTIEVPHPGDLGGVVIYSVMMGENSSGEIKEVFISSNKATAPLDIAGRDIATLISIALQHGASIAELAGAVSRDDKGDAQGAAGAVLDAMLCEASS